MTASAGRGLRLSCEGRSRSGPGLARAIEAAAAPTRPGALLPLREADPLRLAVRVLAARRGGAVPLPGDGRWRPAHWRRLLERCGTWSVPAGTAWAAFTSGSTGTPRAVLRNHASWRDSFGALGRLLELIEDETVYATAPLPSSMTLFELAHAQERGHELLLSAGPAATAGDLARATVAHTTPAGLHRIVSALEAGAPSRLRRVLVGGQALPERLRSRAEGLGLRVLAYYGAAELSFVAIDEGDGMRPFPGVACELRERADGLGAELWVRSPYLASGYAGDQTGPLRRDGDGWASVGDLAEPGPAGGASLRLRGRADGALLVAGATVLPEDVELVLREAPGVRDAAVIGLPRGLFGQLPAAVLETGGDGADPRRLRDFARDRLPLSHRPRAWFRLQRLPRTANGKLRRDRVARAVARAEAERLG